MALRNIGNIQTEVLVRSQQNTTSGHITDTMLDNWLKEKHRWAASYRKWPMTEGRASTTYGSLVTDENGDLRGELFEGWKTDSIRLMRVGGKFIRKTNMQQYYRFREDQPDNTERIFTDYGRSYYLNPNADVSGSIVLWGQYTPIDLDTTDKEATTIFSEYDENGNEALVEAMIGEIMMRSDNPNEAQVHISKSVGLLDSVWNKIEQEQHGYHMGDVGMFEHVDYLVGGHRDDVLNTNRWY